MPEVGPAPGFDLVAILPEVEEAGDRLAKAVIASEASG